MSSGEVVAADTSRTLAASVIADMSVCISAASPRQYSADVLVNMIFGYVSTLFQACGQ